MEYIFRSKRLGFRQWKESDIIPFAELCNNKDVMEYFPKMLNLEETKASIVKFRDGIDTYHTGFFAVDYLEDKKFIGFIGVIYQTMPASFTPCYEIGWRLNPNYWNKGLATEGALKCLDHSFKELSIEEVYSITPILNKKSERIMLKVGMNHVGFFNHPKLDFNSHLLCHTIYKISKEDFESNL